MYYASLFKQFEYENIDDTSWSNISKEICQFLSHEKVNAFWDDRIVNSKMWNRKFIEYGNLCLKKGG
jgi:hypothetical protein